MEDIKKFEDFLDRMQGLLDNAKKQGHIIVRVEDLENAFPELKESEDEKIRKALLEMVHDTTGDSLWVDYNIHKEDAIAWLEKQGEQFIKWNKNTEGNKPQANHSVLMKTTHGIAEGEWNGVEHWIQYRWSSSVKDSDVLSWMELSDLDKQDGHEHAKLSEDEEIDEEYKIGKWFTGLIPCWINAPSTLQPVHSKHGKNVVAIHLKGGGYRCCCIDDKEPIVFNVAENTPFEEGWRNRESSAWSEEDENHIQHISDFIMRNRVGDTDAIYRLEQDVKWLKFLKDRYTWKPSDEQMKALKGVQDGVFRLGILESLYNDLKKLRNE